MIQSLLVKAIRDFNIFYKKTWLLYESKYKLKASFYSIEKNQITFEILYFWLKFSTQTYGLQMFTCQSFWKF